jgi:hypothetical protein
VPPTELKAEVALGEHGEEDQPARKHGLHDRKRRQGEGTDMQRSCGHRHDPAEHERAGAEQTRSAAHRMTQNHDASA